VDRLVRLFFGFLSFDFGVESFDVFTRGGDFGFALGSRVRSRGHPVCRCFQFVFRDDTGHRCLHALASPAGQVGVEFGLYLRGALAQGALELLAVLGFLSERGCFLEHRRDIVFALNVGGIERRAVEFALFLFEFAFLFNEFAGQFADTLVEAFKVPQSRLRESVRRGELFEGGFRGEVVGVFVLEGEESLFGSYLIGEVGDFARLCGDVVCDA